MAMTTPINIQLQLQQMERKRALANALMQQSMQVPQTQMTGPIAVKQSPLEGISRLAEAFAANKMNDRLDQQSTDIGQNYMKQMAQAYAGMYGGGGTSPDYSNQQTPPAMPQGGQPSPMSVGGAQISNTPPNPISAPPMQNPPQGQSAPQMPLMASPQTLQGGPAMGGGQSPQQLAQMAMINPDLADQLYLKGVPAPSNMAALMAEQQRYPQGSQQWNIYQNQIMKESGRQPMELRGGSAMMLPDANGQYHMAGMMPKLGEGQGYDPNTGSIGNLPGAVGAASQMAGGVAGAQAAAKTPYTPMPGVTNAAGQEVPMSQAQYLNLGKQIAAPMLNGSQPSQIAPQAEQGSDPWQTMPKIGYQPGVGEATYQKGISGERAKSASTLVEKYGNVADMSNWRMAINNQALSELNNADTGFGASHIMSVRNALARAGFGDVSKATSDQVLQKDLVNAAVSTARQNFGGRITQSEVMLQLQKANPNMDMTKAAIDYLLKTDNAKSQYQVDQANNLGKYLDSGGDPLRFEGWYSHTFPMSDAFKALEPAQSSTQQGQQSAPAIPHPQDIVDELRRRGVVQ